MNVDLFYGGQSYPRWHRYEVTQSLEQAGGSFSLQVDVEHGRDVVVSPGGLARLQVAGQAVLVGRVDEVRTRRAPSTSSVTLVGRDLGGLLIDASAPIGQSWRRASLSTIARRVAAYAGMPSLPQLDEDPTIDKLKVEAGESCWRLLERAAATEGLRMWVAPDGVLRIGQYSRTGEALAELRRDQDPSATNLISSQVIRSVADAYSQVEVVGHYDAGSSGTRLRGSWTDADFPFFKPLVETADVSGHAQANKEAEKLGTARKATQLRVIATVQGHGPAEGTPWAVNQLVHLRDAWEGLDEPLLVVARTFRVAPREGTLTDLELARPEYFDVAAG